MSEQTTKEHIIKGTHETRKAAASHNTVAGILAVGGLERTLEMLSSL